MSEEQTEHAIDRTGWDAGPWDREPDKMNWKTSAGLPGMIVRNRSGALCGYVAIAHGHPCFGRDYTRNYELGPDGEPDFNKGLPNPVFDLEVHGGITYGNACAGHICHVPEPGEPDDVWWLGFDCAHSGDYSPRDATYRSKYGETFARSDWETYRDITYVRGQVEGLAAQLVAMALARTEGESK